MPTRFNKSQYLELVLNPGQPEVTFSPQQFLQNRQMYSLELYSSNDVTTSKSNIPLATPDIISAAYLTLYCSDVNLPSQLAPDGTANGNGMGEWFRSVPLWTFHRLNNQTDPFNRDLFEMFGELTVWELSKVQIADPAIVTSQCVLLFNVGYK